MKSRPATENFKSKMYEGAPRELVMMYTTPRGRSAFIAHLERDLYNELIETARGRARLAREVRNNGFKVSPDLSGSVWNKVNGRKDFEALQRAKDIAAIG